MIEKLDDTKPSNLGCWDGAEIADEIRTIKQKINEVIDRLNKYSLAYTPAVSTEGTVNDDMA